MFTTAHLLRIAHPAAAFHSDVDRLLDGASSPAQPSVRAWADDDAATVRAAMPGFTLEDIDVEVYDRTLRLSGEHKDNGEHTYLCRERFTGRFDQRVRLPFSVDADGAQASLNNGVLEVRLPRQESDKPRKIAINAQN